MSKEQIFGNEAIRAAVDTYMQIQKVRIAANNRLKAMELNDEYHDLREQLMKQLAELEKVEKSIAKSIMPILNSNPLYTQWLQHIKGVGPILAAKFLAIPLDPNRHISSWNARFGLTPFYYKLECKKGHKMLYPKLIDSCPYKDPTTGERCGEELKKIEKVSAAPKPISGYRIFWDKRAKQVAFLLEESFKKTGNFYKLMFFKFQKYELQMALQGEKEIKNLLHLNLRAGRKTVQLFLSHTHTITRRILNLPEEKPYAFEYLQHDDYIDPTEVLEKEKMNLKPVITEIKAEVEELKKKFEQQLKNKKGGK